MIRGVAFDMDGTLTRPVLNFRELREKIGISSRAKPIFEQILEMQGPAQERALAILESEEMKAAENSSPNPGLSELLDFLDQGSIRKGIYTRNSRQALEKTLSLLGVSGRFSPLLTRDHKLRLKPEPDMILHILSEWKLSPGEVLVVGDYDFDVMAGKSAGCAAVFLSHNHAPAPAGADFVIERLDQLIDIIGGHHEA